ncbi:ribonuclease H-like domain-containing protein [Tanacetum coccineum]
MTRRIVFFITDTACVVLSPDFKLTDENYVLLKVPRKDNMYSVDLKNVVPHGGLTCLFAKATPDESNLWHRRLGHINFKTMNKLNEKRPLRIYGCPDGNFIRPRFFTSSQAKAIKQDHCRYKHGVPPTKRLFRVAMLDPSQGFIDPWGKFGDLELPSVDRSLLALRPSRLCAQARSEDGMPFHTSLTGNGAHKVDAPNVKDFTKFGWSFEGHLIHVGEVFPWELARGLTSIVDRRKCFSDVAKNCTYGEIACIAICSLCKSQLEAIKIGASGSLSFNVWESSNAIIRKDDWSILL